jgi:hypothetical protein
MVRNPMTDSAMILVGITVFLLAFGYTTPNRQMRTNCLTIGWGLAVIFGSIGVGVAIS